MSEGNHIYAVPASLALKILGEWHGKRWENCYEAVFRFVVEYS